MPAAPVLQADHGLSPRGPGRAGPHHPRTGNSENSTTKSRLATLTHASTHTGRGRRPRATRAGGVRSRLPIGNNLAKNPAQARPKTGPQEGPSPVPRGSGSFGTPGAGRGKIRKRARQHRRADAGPGPRGRTAGARARNALPPVPPRPASPFGRHGPRSLGDGRRSLPQKPAPPICGERAKRRRPGTTGTIPPVRPAARNASSGTAARSLPLPRPPELRREATI